MPRTRRSSTVDAADVSVKPLAGTHRPEQEDSARHYGVSRLPVLVEKNLGDAVQPFEVLKLEFSEICSAWRMLTDVRFKLLALVPPIAALGLVGIVSTAGPFVGVGVVPRVGLAAFGLLVTLGLYVYDQRNSELYDELISRGRRVEDELNVATGLFRGRPKPKHRWVKHGNATGLIYGVVGISWIGAGIFAVITHS